VAGKIIAGIELFAQGARVALVTLKPVVTVVHCAELAFQTGDETRVAQMVTKVLEDAGVAKADAHLVFTPPAPANGRHALFIAPNMKKAELQQIATRELKREGSLDAEKSLYVVDKLGAAEAIEGEANSAGQWHMITALQREPVEATANSFAGSRLVLRTASTSMVGILRALSLVEMPKEVCVAVCHLDPKRSALMVLDNGTPRFTRDIPTTFARGGREGADDMLVAQAVAREIDISLVFFAQQHRPKHVDHLIFVGDAEIAERVQEFLGEAQGYNITRFVPNEKLVAAEGVPANLLSYAPAIGAAMASRKARFYADVLPAEMRGRPEQAIGVAIGAVLLAVMMVFIAQSYRTATQLATEQTKRVKEAEAKFEKLAPQVETLKKLDEQYAFADRWVGFFESLNIYHRRVGNFLFNLPNTLPVTGLYTSVEIHDLPPPHPPPLPGSWTATSTSASTERWSRKTSSQPRATCSAPTPRWRSWARCRSPRSPL